MTRAELLAELEQDIRDLLSSGSDGGLLLSQEDVANIIAALHDAERLEAERDKAVAILKAGRLAYCNMQNEGANLIDFLNLWLDQEKQKAERMEAEVDWWRRHANDATKQADDCLTLCDTYAEQVEQLRAELRAKREESPRCSGE